MRKRLDWNKARDLFLEGVTAKDISKQMNVGYTTVHYALRQMGFDTSVKRKFDPEEAYALYKSGEKTTNLAARYGVSPGRIIQAFKRRNLPMGIHPREPKPVYKDLLREDIQAYINGESILSIRRRTGLYQGTIRNSLVRAGVEIRPKENPMYDEAKRMYESDPKWTLKTLAKFFSVNHSTLHDALRYRGCAMRPPSQGGDRSKPRGKDNQLWGGGGIYGRPNRLVHQQVQAAIRRGEILPKPCEVCGVNRVDKNGKRTVHAHHDDYNKPFEIRWLCRSHHQIWHMSNRPRLVGEE